MASTYNPYSDIQKVFNAKVGWNNATTDEERKRQNEIANAARKNLEAYGYGDVATKISASGADATAARKIMEQYAPQTSVNDTDSQLITKHNNEIRNKTNELWGIQKTDRETMANKYNKLEETAYSNPFTTDEAQAILGKYSLAGLNARDNAVASGGGSNGGNIDSYSAANAMRQQASLISQGHTAVLDAHNNRINNVKGILSDLGIYQQNQDKGMQNTIGLQQNESQRLFENGETAKNNETARQEVYSNISGTVGDTVTKALNSNIWNADGTLKNYTQNYQADIENLEKALYSTTNESEKAKIMEKLRVLESARNQKIDEQGLSYGKTYKYQSAPYTEAHNQFEKQDKLARDTLNTESEVSKYKIDSDKAIEMIKAAENSGDDYAAYNTLLSVFDVSETRKRSFIEEEIKPIYEGKKTITPEGLKQLILTNSEKYNIDVDDATLLCRAFGVDTSWLSGYRDRTDDDGILKNGDAGRYGGMIKK